MWYTVRKGSPFYYNSKLFNYWFEACATVKLVIKMVKRSVGRPNARWSDDLRWTAGRSWMRVAEDLARWRDIGEAYVQQWTVVG
jgi:hypothetical protein